MPRFPPISIYCNFICLKPQIAFFGTEQNSRGIDPQIASHCACGPKQLQDVFISIGDRVSFNATLCGITTSTSFGHVGCRNARIEKLNTASEFKTFKIFLPQLSTISAMRHKYFAECRHTPICSFSLPLLAECDHQSACDEDP